MNGDNSIVGRSVVIHDPDNNSRIGCANIDKVSFFFFFFLFILFLGIEIWDVLD